MIFNISKIIFSSLLLMNVQLVAQTLSPDDFVTTWQTYNNGTSNDNQITIPTDDALSYNYNVDWNNDGIFDQFGITGNITHTFNSPGTYTIRINGDFPRIYFQEYIDNPKIISIDQWGTQAWTSMRYAFYNCRQLQGNATDIPNLSNVTDMSYMFFFAENFNQNINNWNTSNVTNMQRTFSQATNFNQPLDEWNTANVTNMREMFHVATNFNQSLNNWDTSNVTDMSYMFSYAENFNGDIGAWNTSNITNMSNMFHRAYDFNKDIGNWNTSNVLDITDMFSYASSFNQNIGIWDISGVTSLKYTFYVAESFNQPLDNWDTSNVTDMAFMFAYANSFNQDLGNWNTSNVTNMEYIFLEASSFNGDLSSWDTSNLVNMDRMFENASSFNQDIGNWDTSNVTDMNRMFRGAVSFDQNIGEWNISNLTTAQFMFEDVILSTENYDSLLIGWQAQPHNNGVHFHGGESIPDLGLPARDSLHFDDAWSIIDGAGVLLGVSDKEQTDFIVYPNPSKGIVNIDLGFSKMNAALTYSVTSITGQVIINETQINSNNASFILDLTKFTNGIYFINIQTETGSICKKIMKN